MVRLSSATGTLNRPPKGWVTLYVLFFIHLGARRVELGGITANPNEAWMTNVARQITMLDFGFHKQMRCRYFIHAEPVHRSNEHDVSVLEKGSELPCPEATANGVVCH